jgi:phosphatidate cytidylyltransferase
MKLRVLTAVPLALLVAALLWRGPKWLFLVVLVATVEIGLREFFVISRQSGFKAFPAAGYATGVVLCLAQAPWIGATGWLVLAVLVFVVLLSLSLALVTTKDLKQYLGAAATTIFGILYVALALSWLMPLRFSEHKLAWATGRELVFLVFLVIWAGDIFAYLGGRAVGRTPLFPRVSPKKTAEGAVAGFAGSLLAAWVLVRWFWQTADLKTVMLWAAMIALAGQVGDLVESALKRGADLKDSGSILPGHGGLLDRIDSLLFGVPALWLALTLKEMLK